MTPSGLPTRTSRFVYRTQRRWVAPLFEAPLPFLMESWCKQSPADFDIEVKSAEALFSELPEGVRGSELSVHARTRLMYARVRVVDAGVRTPIVDGSHQRATPEPVPFILILEPLYGGVLPASVLPTVVFLCIVVFVAARWVVPPVQQYLYAVADEVRKEVVIKRAKSE